MVAYLQGKLGGVEGVRQVISLALSWFLVFWAQLLEGNVQGETDLPSAPPSYTNWISSTVEGADPPTLRAHHQTIFP